MACIGVLLAPEAFQAGLVIGGITLLERQARTLRRAGCTTLLLVAPQPLTKVPEGVETVTMAGLPARMADAGFAVVLAPGLTIDERAVAAILDVEEAAILVSDGASHGGVERLDAANLASGVMKLPAAMLAEVAGGLGDWDFHSTLIRLAAADPTVTRISIADIELYAPERRRLVPMIWARPVEEAAAAETTRLVIAAAQKGALDWPARFVHPLIEDTLVRLLAPSFVTPNMVTLVTAILGFAAAGLFAAGMLWWALGLALLCGPLDGVDGKLARTRIEFSRWGDLEHVLDKLIEYVWYLCAAWWFSGAAADGGLGSGLPWAVAALIIFPALSESLQGEFFRRITGKQLDDAGTFERRLRLVAGRRNTFLWTWAAMAAMGWWFQGFVLLAGYSMVTTAITQWRFYSRLGEFLRAGDARVKANYAASSYGFLTKASLPSEPL